jgi:hypothetical protein
MEKVRESQGSHAFSLDAATLHTNAGNTRGIVGVFPIAVTVLSPPSRGWARLNRRRGKDRGGA